MISDIAGQNRGGRIMTDYGVGARSKAKPGFRGVMRLATGAALLCAAVSGMAQVSGAPASAGGAGASEKHPAFEVISIKRHNTEGGPEQNGRPGPTPDGFRSIGLP